MAVEGVYQFGEVVPARFVGSAQATDSVSKRGVIKYVTRVVDRYYSMHSWSRTSPRFVVVLSLIHI